MQTNDTYCRPLPLVEQNECSAASGPLCTPFRSLEYCDVRHSFPSRIRTRTDFIQGKQSQLDSEGWWFHNLDDKMAGYVYAAEGGYNAPQIYFCTSDILGGLEEFNTTNPVGRGFVIRATGQHSSQGVYALPDGFGGIEKLRGFAMSLEDVQTDLLDVVGAEGLVIEEYVIGPGGELPTEYKFHMFNGEVGSISVVSGRGTSCGCWAEIDADGERLDQFGCFAPAGSQRTAGQCTGIDFNRGSMDPRKVKGFDLCSSVPEIAPCLFQDMIDLAKKVSLEVGVYIRIDMFAMTDNFYLQEFSTNHMNGARHCSARLDENDCIDSCFQGRLWIKNGLSAGSNFTMGGRQTPIPSSLSTLLNTDGFDARCNIVTSMTPTRTTSSCLGLAATVPPVANAPIAPLSTPSTSLSPTQSPAPSGRMEGSFKSDSSASPSSHDPMPFFCPMENPNGNQCALPEMLDCFYDQLCCADGRCEFTTSCNCINGTFVCTREPPPICPPRCPNQPPSTGDLCEMTSDLHCPYDETCCEGTPLCFVAISCRCAEQEDGSGAFVCLNLPVALICSLERTAEGDFEPPHNSTQP